MVNQYNAKLIQHIKWMQEIVDKLQRYSNDKSYDDFCADEMCRDACITALTQLGEISNAIKKGEYEPYHIELPIKEMTEMRNFLVHNYHKVDIDILWKTITESVPALSHKIKDLL